MQPPKKRGRPKTIKSMPVSILGNPPPTTPQYESPIRPTVLHRDDTAMPHRGVIEVVRDTIGQRELIHAAIRERENELPHLYGFPFYKWSREFFESRKKMNFLCAANQISKSSTAIRKNIEWACNKNLWPLLWPNREPKQFFYFYPTSEIATSEFLKKWVPEFLPRGAMREHEWYGWEAQMSAGEIVAIHFRAGVSIYFKGYAQKIANLQSSTVDMVTGDEEMPSEYAAELLARLFASDGYWNMVFTATIGQELWYQTMERMGHTDEAYPQAAKWIVSMYDCMFYEDGSPSPWTEARIKEKEGMCGTENERLRRIMGRFVRDYGRRYSSFNPEKNVGGDGEIPEGWNLYAVVDIGSGRTAARKFASCGAILFLAVNKEYTRAKIIKSWRGDGIETTSPDLLNLFLQMASTLPKTIQNVYDYGSKEFGLTAERAHVPFIMCNKKKVSGDSLVNLLFKLQALQVPPGIYDNQKLINELMLVPVHKVKTANDDLSDALKYVCMAVPWNHQQLLKDAPKGVYEHYNFEAVAEDSLQEFPDPSWTSKQYAAWEVATRRGSMNRKVSDGWGLDEEIAEWNDAYG